MLIVILVVVGVVGFMFYKQTQTNSDSTGGGKPSETTSVEEK
jgi:hypothetical protein